MSECGFIVCVRVSESESERERERQRNSLYAREGYEETPPSHSLCLFSPLSRCRQTLPVNASRVIDERMKITQTNKQTNILDERMLHFSFYPPVDDARPVFFKTPPDPNSSTLGTGTSAWL